MIPHWQPCEEGQKLYDAYCNAADYDTESLDLAARADFAWSAWYEHRTTCPVCMGLKQKRDCPVCGEKGD